MDYGQCSRACYGLAIVVHAGQKQENVQIAGCHAMGTENIIQINTKEIRMAKKCKGLKDHGKIKKIFLANMGAGSKYMSFIDSIQPVTVEIDLTNHTTVDHEDGKYDQEIEFIIPAPIPCPACGLSMQTKHRVGHKRYLWHCWSCGEEVEDAPYEDGTKQIGK